MVRFRIECTLPFPREQFWRIRDSQPFFDFVVQDGLLKDLKASKPEYDEDGWGTRIQHYCPANVDCPNMLRTVVGDTLFEVSDEQRWNDKLRPYHLQFFIKPSFLSGLSRTYGELSIEKFSGTECEDEYSADGPLEETVAENEDDTTGADSSTELESSEASDSSDMEGAESIEGLIERLPVHEKSSHVVSGETRVSILTLGWFVERAIVHNLRKFYQEYPATVARFRQQLYRDYAGCDETVPISVVVDRFLKREEKSSCLTNILEQKLDATIDSEKDEQESDDEYDFDEKIFAFESLKSPRRVDEDMETLMMPS